ncbi:MAG TPA: transcription antitermination factor NusB [Clostridiaceae bacterium]|nr:transcription antitermination factor NusB [Clostridiaceae bacterium]
MGRRFSREIAMKLLYQMQIQPDNKEEQLKEALEKYSFSQKDKEYIEDVVKGVLNNLDKIDKIIEERSIGWKLNRIPKVDLAILRLGAYEILFRDDIPYTVTINEAVELAKKYSTEDSGAFINGIFSNIPKGIGLIE